MYSINLRWRSKHTCVNATASGAVLDRKQNRPTTATLAVLDRTDMSYVLRDFRRERLTILEAHVMQHSHPFCLSMLS